MPNDKEETFLEQWARIAVENGHKWNKTVSVMSIPSDNNSGYDGGDEVWNKLLEEAKLEWGLKDMDDGRCKHKYKQYVGLTESYAYCEKCDEKYKDPENT